MTTTIRSTVARALALAAAVLGLALVPSPPAADAAIGKFEVKLTIQKDAPSPGTSNVAVFGAIEMPRAEAEALLSSGHRVVMRIWEEDLVYDDLVLSQYDATAFVPGPDFPVAGQCREFCYQGIHFHKVRLGIPNSRLDQDPEGADEIYASVRLINAAGKDVRTKRSNTVTRSF